MSGDGDRDGPGDAAPKDERDDRPELDVDAAFAAIVAEYARPAAGGVGPWPAAEDVDDAAADPGGTPAAPQTRAPGSAPAAAPDDAPFRAGRGPRHRLPDGSVDPRTGSGEDPADAHPPYAGSRRAGPGGPDDDHDRFVPPDAPPITSTDPVTRLAWLGVVGGPLFLLVAALVAHALPTLVVVAALGAFIGGFVTLVARLPRDRGDDGDDGAVV